MDENAARLSSPFPQTRTLRPKRTRSWAMSSTEGAAERTAAQFSLQAWLNRHYCYCEKRQDRGEDIVWTCQCGKYFGDASAISFDVACEQQHSEEYKSWVAHTPGAR